MIAKIDVDCPMCGKTQKVEVNKAKYMDWYMGAFIQDVWPDKTPEWRDTLRTGYCSDCQKKLFAEPEL